MANDEEAAAARKPHTGKDEAKLLEDLRTASIKTNVAWLRTIHQAKSTVVTEEAAGAAGARSGGTDDLDFSWLNDLVIDVAGEHLASYNRTLDLSARYGDRFIGALRDVMRARRPRARTVQSRSVLEIAAGPGTRAAGAFSVRNSTQARAMVTFRIAEFVDVEGGPPFAVRVDIVAVPAIADRAAERWLEPAELRVFRVGFDVAEPFEAGHRYTCGISVLVEDRPVEDIPVRVSVA
jgi:hypothetical protein